MWLQRTGWGLVAGAIGTAVMDTSQSTLIPAMTSWVQSRLKSGDGGDQSDTGQGESSHQPSEEEQPLSSPEKVVKRGAEFLGIELDRKDIGVWGNRIHWVYGTQWGAIYQLVRPAPGLQSGLLYGAALWLVSDEVLLWALGIAKAPNNYPLSTHLQALAAHCIYGSVVGVVTKGLRS